jgi:UDP-GlcNAc3NAcA epimerase
MKKVVSIIGARPQFIKHAPVQLQLQKYFDAITIHTGQHYDSKMSDIFFTELNMQPPNYLYNLNGAHTQGHQTAKMLCDIEDVLVKEKPQAVIVYGDTNSTLAGVLAAVKLHIPIIHIEAGLRSFNRHMPEEVNRIVADEFSKILFCPSKVAIENLLKEGISHEHIYLTGDVMCDMIHLVKSKIMQPAPEPYYYATIHRPYNTDDKAQLTKILTSLNTLSHQVILPIHPRTTACMASFNMQQSTFSNIKFIEPQSYINNISYLAYAQAVITDSGGVQKEAYILQKQCITLRSETEWTETLHDNWNTLMFEDMTDLKLILSKPTANHNPQLFGDGDAAKHIVAILKSIV